MSRPRPQTETTSTGVGQRVAQLRSAHGESLREAAQRTGVSHTTITRIEKGEVTCSFHSTLEKIAAGYGVEVGYLLTGRQPREEFRRLLRAMSEEQRHRLYLASPQERARLLWEFLCLEHHQSISREMVAAQAGLNAQELDALLSGLRRPAANQEAFGRVAAALSRLTGISQHWFYGGGLEEEACDPIPVERLPTYVRLLKKAARHRVDPAMLEAAIDLLILQQNRRHGAEAGMGSAPSHGPAPTDESVPQALRQWTEERPTRQEPLPRSGSGPTDSDRKPSEALR